MGNKLPDYKSNVNQLIDNQIYQPLLSIIIPGRNDGFMANFNYRLETTINCLAKNLEIVGQARATEIIVCDWGSEIPLYRVLNLSDAAQRVTRHIVVPPSQAKDLQDDAEFPIVRVQNVAIRRARGTFVMQTDSDVIFTADFLSNLFHILNGQLGPSLDLKRALFGSKRRHIPWAIIEHSPSVEELEIFTQRNGHLLEMEVSPDFKFCATGMMFAHRELWDECSGYDESLIHWGWMEIDLGMRISQRYPYLDVTDILGMIIFHMEHYQGKREVTRQRNPNNVPINFRPNGDNWGYPQYQFEDYRYPSPARFLLA